MKFTLFTSALMAALVASVSAKPVHVAREQLDVFTPTIISPNCTTVWTEGQQYNVTWKTSNAPVNISNVASVRLGVNHTITKTILASNFNLRTGWVTITVPSDLTPGNYSIFLFGDSGDESDQFPIVAPNVIDTIISSL